MNNMAFKRCPDGSVGVIIENSLGHILLIDRATFPYGYAAPAGHTETGKVPEDAARREIVEEVGLKFQDITLVWHGVIQNPCRRGYDEHEWWVYRAKASESAIVRIDKNAARGARWVEPEKLMDLAAVPPGLEKVWQEHFKRLGYAQ